MCSSDLQSALAHILAEPKKATFVAFQFMLLLGNSIAYWKLVKLSIASQQQLDTGVVDKFLNQKIATTAFYQSQILPRNQAHLEAIISDSSFMDDD